MDFVYIATESGNHAEHIMKCFNANKNVIVEKPPVLRVSQLINLEKIARKKKLLFYVIFQNRLNKSVVFVKKILNIGQSFNEFFSKNLLVTTMSKFFNFSIRCFIYFGS